MSDQTKVIKRKPKHIARWGAGAKKQTNMLFYGILALLNMQFAIFNKEQGVTYGWVVFCIVAAVLATVMFILVTFKMPEDR